jgi:hypothetical protein
LVEVVYFSLNVYPLLGGSLQRLAEAGLEASRCHTAELLAAAETRAEMEDKYRSGNIQGTFREHSGNIQGTFRERSGNLR